MAPPRGAGEEASLKEQKEAGLEQGEAEQEAGLMRLPLGGGEARLGLINPRPALVAIGRRVGRLRKREVRRLPPWHPAPPSSICPAPSRAERDI